MGIAAALVFCNFGAAYGTARSGVGITSVGISKPELVFKSLIPIIMAGILGIYGLIVAVILQGKGNKNNPSYKAFFSLGNSLQHHVRPKPMAVQLIQWLQAVCIRPLLRPLITSCRSLHRCCWRCWRESKRSEGYLRWSHPDFDFRRGTRSLWTYCLNYPLLNLDQLLIRFEKRVDYL